MKILAIDTSGRVASVALSEGEVLLGEITSNTAYNHSVRLMPMVDELLRLTETDVSEVDVFAVATGPGSFTGLRIGIATVKAMASVGNRPVAGVTTLEGMAGNFLYSDRLVCPLIDARNRQVFAAGFDTRQGEAQERVAVSSYIIDEYLEAVERVDRPAVFLGDGAPLHRALIESRLKGRASFAPAGLNLQRAACLIPAALHQMQEGTLSHYREVVPIYLKKSQPEREVLERKQRKG